MSSSEESLVSEWMILSDDGGTTCASSFDHLSSGVEEEEEEAAGASDNELLPVAARGVGGVPAYNPAAALPRGWKKSLNKDGLVAAAGATGLLPWPLHIAKMTVRALRSALQGWYDEADAQFRVVRR